MFFLVLYPAKEIHFVYHLTDGTAAVSRPINLKMLLNEIYSCLNYNETFPLFSKFSLNFLLRDAKQIR